MRKKSNTEQNSSPEIICNAPWRVTSVKPLDNYTLDVKFNDGLYGFVELKDLITGNNSGIFYSLHDINIFNQVFVLNGVITWPGEIDIAPDAIHNDILQHGKCILK